MIWLLFGVRACLFLKTILIWNQENENDNSDRTLNSTCFQFKALKEAFYLIAKNNPIYIVSFPGFAVHLSLC